MAEMMNHVAGSTAHVEQAEAGCFGQVLIHQRGQGAGAAGKPPMKVLF
jgi:hypothetical protein